MAKIPVSPKTIGEVLEDFIFDYVFDVGMDWNTPKAAILRQELENRLNREGYTITKIRTRAEREE